MGKSAGQRSIQLKWVIAVIYISTMVFVLNSCARREKTIRYTDSKGNQVSLFTKSQGRGRPILFIHGNCCDNTIWEKQFKSEGFKNNKMIAYDLRGHGKSVKYREPEKATSQYSLKLHAEDLEKVLEYYNDDNIIVVGWSLGGTILLRYLEDYKNPLISKALIYGAIPSNGFSGVKDYPVAPLTASLGFLIKGILLNPDPDESFREIYIRASLGKETDIQKLEEIPREDLERFSKIVKNTDGYSRPGLVEGIEETFLDLADGKLDMDRDILTSYNIYQAEMISGIKDIRTPVKILISDNDYWPKSQFEYMKKINPDMFSIAYTGKTGHGLQYNSPEILEKELITFIDQ